MGYATVRFNMWAVIGTTAVELVQFGCSYAMNTIPSCTALLPVGWYALPPYGASTAHALTTGEQLQIPLTVYATITYVSGDLTAVLPTGTYILFCGWVTGVGYRRTYNGYHMAIEGTHWLSALSFSSTLSATSHPNNPTHFIFNSRIYMGAGGGLGHFVPRTAAQSHINKTNITTDFWEDALKPWLLDLASQDRINETEIGLLGGNTDNDSAGSECTAALNAFVPTVMPMDDSAVDGDYMAAAIADDIAVTTLTPSNASNTMTSMAHTTFWDKLVGELAPKYFFSIIPYPTRARVVPFIPGLRNFWDPYSLGYTILARDMQLQDLQSYLPRATRAVGLFSGHGSRAGGNLRVADAVTESTIGGWYEGREDGIVILREAPKYLSSYVVPSMYSADSTGASGSVRGNGFNYPAEGTAPTLQDTKTTKEESQTVMSRLAHAMYVNELLKNRFGDITSPVRFDIAPGSTIRIEGTDGTFLASGEARYASVTRVSHQFDAQHQQCNTSFRLAHVRTETEHNSDNYTLTAHPLYTTIWAGDYNLATGLSCPW